MKAKLFLILFACALSSIAVQSGNSEVAADELEQIRLQGSLISKTTRSFHSPLDVIKNYSSLTITFNQNLNNIRVEVYNELGESVYCQKVNLVYGEQMQINIIGWEKCKYTISFSNDSGGYMLGNFEVTS